MGHSSQWWIHSSECGETVLNESRRGHQDLYRSEILCVKVKDQTNQLRDTFTKSIMGRRLVRLCNSQRSLKTKRHKWTMDLTMVEGMNLYGGYVWPARLSAVFVNVGVLEDRPLSLTSNDFIRLEANWLKPILSKVFQLNQSVQYISSCQRWALWSLERNASLCPDAWPSESDRRLQQTQSRGCCPEGPRWETRGLSWLPAGPSVPLVIGRSHTFFIERSW